MPSVPSRMMEDLWDRAEKLLAAGKPFVLATIIRTRGSVPREVGAKMVIPRDGQPFGTIGGGCGEAEVLRRASPLFAQQSPPRVVQVDLTGDFDQDEIQVCGGLMDVALDLWRPDEHLELARALAEATQARRPTALVTMLHPLAALPAGTKSCLSLAGEEVTLAPPIPLAPLLVRQFAASVTAGSPQLFAVSPAGEVVEDAVARDHEWPRIFVDVQPGLQTLLIVGAGHIAQPLCEIGYLLGFRTVVVDDRWAFANRERFPHASEIHVGSFVETLERLEINDQTFAVVVTRGHNWDEASVRTILKRRPAYLGMIGSRRRARATLERLAEQGYSPADLGRVHTPMGLDIAAETPAEIAVAIAAEIIRVRRHGPFETISLAAKARPSGPFKFTG
ncbi:MAG: XdhC family protein [Candidatus Binatia bacterium]|nr:XdhC family protein [Candidatus Binatia bacterium]